MGIVLLVCFRLLPLPGALLQIISPTAARVYGETADILRLFEKPERRAGFLASGEDTVSDTVSGTDLTHRRGSGGEPSAVFPTVPDRLLPTFGGPAIARCQQRDTHMKSSIRLLAFTAAFLAVGFVETAHAQDRPNAFPLLREARGGEEVWIATPSSAPGNLVADTSIVGGVAAAAVGGGLVIANNGGGTGGGIVSASRPTSSSKH
jgi:hypothetical protein